MRRNRSTLGFPRRQAASIPAALLLVLGMGAGACARHQEPVEPVAPAAEASEVDSALGRARAAADQMGLQLMTALGEQLESAVPATAITVCSEIAPAAAREISRDGLEIRRTSERSRNPANAPEAWERAGLERFAQSVAAGETPAEVHEIDEASGELRYLRPIVVGTGCLLCHGAADELDPGVRDQLAESYPQDLATGYAVGDLRGAFSVRVRLGEL